MFTLRQGIFQVKGHLKSFDPLPDGVRLNFIDGPFVEVPRITRGLLKVMTSVGLSKLQDATVDVTMGKVFLNEERRQKLEKEKRDRSKKVEVSTEKTSDNQ